MTTFLSLFAGVGGFDLGAQAAGWDCVGQVEIADTYRYKMAGNRITAPVAQWVCEQINLAERVRF